jgi:hypothetical protein
MKKPILISILGLIFLSPCFGQKTRYGQSSPVLAGPEIKLHIGAAHIRERCANVSLSPQIDCRDALYVDAVLNGKKVELVGRRLEPGTGTCFRIAVAHQPSGTNRALRLHPTAVLTAPLS